MNASPIRLMVVDDHPVVQGGVAVLLQSTSSIQLVGSAQSGAEAVDRAEKLQPDIVLLDLRLPDMLAPETITALRRKAPGCRIVIFTAHGGHAAIDAAVDAGASAVLTKDCQSSALLDTIQRVARGHRPVVATPPGSRRTAEVGKLTRQEYAVFRRMAIGESTADIAEALGLSSHTVRTYLQRTLEKLGAHSRVEAIHKATEIGLL